MYSILQQELGIVEEPPVKMVYKSLEIVKLPLETLQSQSVIHVV